MVSCYIVSMSKLVLQSVLPSPRLPSFSPTQSEIYTAHINIINVAKGYSYSDASYTTELWCLQYIPRCTERSFILATQY